MNARTAEHDDHFRRLKLLPCLDVLHEANNLPDCIQLWHNCDKIWDPRKTKGPELVDLCNDMSLLVLHGLTPGDDIGKHTFVSRVCHGQSAIDLFHCICLLHIYLQRCICK